MGQLKSIFRLYRTLYTKIKYHPEGDADATEAAMGLEVLAKMVRSENAMLQTPDAALSEKLLLTPGAAELVVIEALKLATKCEDERRFGVARFERLPSAASLKMQVKRCKEKCSANAENTGLLDFFLRLKVLLFQASIRTWSPPARVSDHFQRHTSFLFRRNLFNFKVDWKTTKGIHIS